MASELDTDSTEQRSETNSIPTSAAGAAKKLYDFLKLEDRGSVYERENNIG